jgi:PAS domain S-box-containing protein
MEAPLPDNEPQRLAALRECDAEDGGLRQSLDAVAKLAASICRTPLALVSLVGAEQQCFAGRSGVESTSWPRRVSFCSWTILGASLLEVTDATADERFADNEAVTGTAKVRFYAGYPLRTSDGHAIGALCVVDRQPRRLTEEQRGQMELLAIQAATQLDLRRWRARCAGAEARAALIVDGAMDAVVTVDEHGVVTGWNAQAEAVFGYTRAQAMGQRMAGLIIPERFRAAHDTGIRRFLQAGGGGCPQRRTELVAMRSDGREIPVELSVMSGRLGGQVFVSAFIRDITERRRVSEELRRAKEAAEDAARVKSEFLANMSHEIRTPMTAVLGFTELLADEAYAADPAQRAEAVGTIRRNGEQLLGIINDVLDLSRIDAGKLCVEHVPTDAREVVADVLRLMGVRATAKGLRVESEVMPGVPRAVLSDPVRVHQVLLNLVSNAVKFTDRGSVRVRVEGRAGDDGRAELAFVVEDTGIGIAPEHLPFIFDAFWQEDGSMTRRFGGTGLGLRISRSLAQLLGGEIDVVSTPGKGSTFTLRFTAPLPPETPARRGLPPAGPELCLAGVRILLAEDGPDNQRLLAHHLRRAGADVTLAEHGAAALELVCPPGACPVRAPAFDLVVMDMQMPVMDGYAAVRALRERGVTLPILALTAHALSSDRERCLAIGCDAFATKPIDRGALLRACEQLLGRIPAVTPARAT